MLLLLAVAGFCSLLLFVLILLLLMLMLMLLTVAIMFRGWDLWRLFYCVVFVHGL